MKCDGTGRVHWAVWLGPLKLWEWGSREPQEPPLVTGLYYSVGMTAVRVSTTVHASIPVPLPRSGEQSV
jgi:hypothetical protein